MELRQSGKHDLKLPVLGICSWAFGGGEYWGHSTQTEVDEVVRYAAAHGCDFFDTAELYYDGGSEQSLGSALERPSLDEIQATNKSYDLLPEFVG
jgi:aryl-alcohol dehydrogenase-like predicted oxidoreductase